MSGAGWMIHACESDLHKKTVVETPFGYEDLCGGSRQRLDASTRPP
jgi:hypothetical protein